MSDGTPSASGTALRAFYADYLACLNARDWPRLERFVADTVVHNGRSLGLTGYRGMLEEDFDAIPDLRFDTRILVVDPPYVASRLQFDCHPKGLLFGVAVNGRRVSFAENVIYEVRRDRIAEVWSVIDKAAVETQLEAV